MLYLFNSAYRANYSKNVLLTLFYPEGWINKYRYRIHGEAANINGADIDGFLNAKGESVLIVFVDRFSPGNYSYYPLRKGKLVNSFTDDERIYFEVKLEGFLFPKEITEFRSNLVNIGRLPSLTDNDPMKTNDGFYAIKASDFTQNINFLSGNEAWLRIITALSTTRAFAATNSQETIFARLKIKNDRRFQFLKRIIDREFVSRVKISKNCPYKFELTYSYPNQNGTNICQLKLISGTSLKFISQEDIDIDNVRNHVDINFQSKKYYEEKVDKIRFEFSTKNHTTENLIAPTCDLPIVIQDGVSFWIQIVFAVLLFTLAEVIMPVVIKEETSFSWQAIIDQISTFMIIGSILKAIALIWIIRLIGKKVL